MTVELVGNRAREEGVTRGEMDLVLGKGKIVGWLISINPIPVTSDRT